MNTTAWEPLGRALRDYQAGNRDVRITVHTDIGDPEELPVSLFFRERADLRPLELEAVERCRGRVLDAGAGAGAIALLLQDQGFRTTAIDPLPEAVRVMRDRGVLDARVGDVYDLPPGLRGEGPFDTVLLLMNGAGLAGSLPGLGVLLGTVRSLLGEGGLLLIDSTDLRGAGENPPPGRVPVPGHSPGSEFDGGDDATGAPSDPDAGYEGELHYQLEYDGERGEPFPYLFVDPDTFRTCAEACGWRFELLAQDDEGNFLAGLTS